jgi:PucR C-terminal helix-turn-helix domain/GGDEF-like domain
VPQVLLAQARLAARNGVSLDTVLRRYFAGFTLFGDFVMEEAENVGLPEGSSPQGLLAAEATHFDRLIEAVSEAHTRERQSRFRTPEQRQAERVRRLLAGEPVDADKLGYELDAWHIAAIGIGSDAESVLRDLAESLDRRLLLIQPGGEAVWAWLGGQGCVGTDSLAERARAQWTVTGALSIGEPAQGLEGWRFSHRQAIAALPIAQQRGKSPVRYADVCLLASALQDEVLVDSLRQLYLEPLSAERDGGAIYKETLRAYLAAQLNVSSAAAALGVKRHTVTNRLRAIEELVGRPIDACTAEIEAALHLDELGYENEAASR